MCDTNQLTSLDVKNGNNQNMARFHAWGNQSLTCIEVDDVTYATTNWIWIDVIASFSTNCNYPINCGTITDITTFSSSLNLYPNPFSTSTTMELPSKPHTMTIYDIVGNKVREEQVSGTTIIERGALTNGVYIIEVRS